MLNRKLYFLFVPDFLYHMHCITRWLQRALPSGKDRSRAYFWEGSGPAPPCRSRSGTELQPMYTYTDLNGNKSAPLSFQSRDALQAHPLHLRGQLDHSITNQTSTFTPTHFSCVVSQIKAIVWLFKRYVYVSGNNNYATFQTWTQK